MITEFSAHSINDRLYRPNDSHWNIAGNELAARLILQHVSAQLRPVDKSDVRFTPKNGHWPDRRLNSSGQDFIKILRGGSGFYKNCSRPERPPPLVEPPFESFDFAFEPNRLDLLYFALNLETIYDVALSAEFGKLARALLFEFFNPDLKLAS